VSIKNHEKSCSRIVTICPITKITVVKRFVVMEGMKIVFRVKSKGGEKNEEEREPLDLVRNVHHNCQNSLTRLCRLPSHHDHEFVVDFNSVISLENRALYCADHEKPSLSSRRDDPF
jgi:hypothetical protein